LAKHSGTHTKCATADQNRCGMGGPMKSVGLLHQYGVERDDILMYLADMAWDKYSIWLTMRQAHAVRQGVFRSLDQYIKEGRL